MNFIKGILIGITMMVPGLSGGSVAMILGLYDKLMYSISNIFCYKNIIFCIKVGLGILIGIFLFSTLLYKFTLLNHFNYIVYVIITINVFLLLREYKTFKLRYMFLFVIGFILMYFLNSQNNFQINLNLISYLLIGFLLAISLILPGLGVTYILYSINLYDRFNLSIINMDYYFLFMLGLSTIISIILVSRIINYILVKDKFLIYSVVIGFLVSSIIK